MLTEDSRPFRNQNHSSTLPMYRGAGVKKLIIALILSVLASALVMACSDSSTPGSRETPPSVSNATPTPTLIPDHTPVIGSTTVATPTPTLTPVPTPTPNPTSPSAVTLTPGDTSDREALVAFYEGTGGSNWVLRDNWNSDAPLAEWHGVKVDRDNRVVELDLHSNGLEGEIPGELGDLSSLQLLYLSGNQLSGRIPGELSNLSNLQKLHLQINQLDGEIPAELGNLSSLRSMVLYVNRLSGALPGTFGNLSSLEWFDLETRTETLGWVEEFGK